MLAYGRNFPDGLSGGSLAYTLQGPLLLVENNADNCAWASWVASYFNNTERALILGGKGLISDDIVRYVLDLSSKDKIKVITNE